VKRLALLIIALLVWVTPAYACGWYLMFPPWVAINQFNAGAPLSDWTEGAGFDTAAECGNFQYSVEQYYATHPHDRQADWQRRLYTASRCVSTDDRRLTE
jgi:hypothetical protein